MAMQNADKPRALFSATGVLVTITFLSLVVVGAIVSLATGSWWALAAAVVVHGLATLAFLMVFLPLLNRGDADEDDRR